MPLNVYKKSLNFFERFQRKKNQIRKFQFRFRLHLHERSLRHLSSEKTQTPQANKAVLALVYFTIENINRNNKTLF
jgi:hypothetical protein